MNAIRLCSVLSAASLILGGCAGGGATAPRTTGVPGAPGAPAKDVQLLFRIPAATAASAHARTPRYVSPATTHVGISLVSNNGNAVNHSYGFFSLTPGTPGCTAQPDGSLQCAITLVTPVNTPVVGNDVFELTMEDAGNATLSHAFVPVTIGPAQAASIPVTLDGVVRSVVVALGNPAPAPGNASSTSVIVTGKDADGYTIVGPGNFDTPVTLTDEDTSGATSLSTTTVSAPGQTVTLSYNGDPHLQYARIAPTVTGLNLAPAQAIAGYLLPQPRAPYLYLALAGSTSYIVGYPLAWLRGPSSTVRPGLLIELPGVTLNRGIAVDHAGNVFAAAYGSTPGSGQVLEFAAGANGISPTPIATIGGSSTGLAFANCCGAPMKIGANGTLFVYANGASPNPVIAEFATGANGNVTPSAVIASKGGNATDTDINAVSAMAADPSGALTVGDLRYSEIPVSGRYNVLETFAPGATSASFQALGQDASGAYVNPQGLSYDPLGRGLFTLIQTSNGSYVAAGTSSTAAFTLPAALGGIKGDGLDQDAQGNFYVNGGTGGPSLIQIFAANATGAPAPLGTLNCCIDPTGLSHLANVTAYGPIAVQR